MKSRKLLFNTLLSFFLMIFLVGCGEPETGSGSAKPAETTKKEESKTLQPNKSLSVSSAAASEAEAAKPQISAKTPAEVCEALLNSIEQKNGEALYQYFDSSILLKTHSSIIDENGGLKDFKVNSIELKYKDNEKKAIADVTLTCNNGKQPRDLQAFALIKKGNKWLIDFYETTIACRKKEDAIKEKERCQKDQISTAEEIFEYNIYSEESEDKKIKAFNNKEDFKEQNEKYKARLFCSFGEDDCVISGKDLDDHLKASITCSKHGSPDEKALRKALQTAKNKYDCRNNKRAIRRAFKEYKKSNEFVKTNNLLKISEEKGNEGVLQELINSGCLEKGDYKCPDGGELKLYILQNECECSIHDKRSSYY